VALDQRAHRAVEDQDAPFEQGAELRCAVWTHPKVPEKEKPVRLRAKRVSLALAVFVSPETPRFVSLRTPFSRGAGPGGARKLKVQIGAAPQG
jgi:hypothetical protein